MIYSQKNEYTIFQKHHNSLKYNNKYPLDALCVAVLKVCIIDRSPGNANIYFILITKYECLKASCLQAFILSGQEALLLRRLRLWRAVFFL